MELRIKKNHKGFTLAEVLITLGIIGIVAAMTLPALIQNYKKETLITRLKKAYTEVYQALVMAEAEHGNHQYWDYGTAFDGDSAVKFVNTYMAPYLKLTRNCGKESGCINDGKVFSLDGIASFITDTRSASVITASGYSIMVTSGGSYVTIRLILSNNKKDQLVFGKNVFDYQCASTQQKMMGVTANLTHDDLRSSPIYGCGKVGGDSSGMNCGMLILFDGWNIGEDYPIKF